MYKNDNYIYIVLTQTGTIVSKIIKCFTRAPYNHVSITTDSELSEMFSFCRYRTRLPLPAGFTNENVNAGLFELLNSVPCQIYKIKISEEQLGEYNRLIEHFKKDTKLYSYNILGLLTILLGIPLKRKTRFVCSQFVAHILEELKIVNFNKDTSLVTPDDFRHLKNAVLLYSGDMKKYTYNKLATI